MTDLASLYVRNHRYQQFMIVGGVVLALVVSVAPRNERALFITGSNVGPKAFAAIAPPPVAFNGLFDDSGPFGGPRYRVGAQRRGSTRGGAAPDGFVSSSPVVGPAGFAPGDVLPASDDPQPLQLASLDPTGRGISGGPLAGSGPTSFGPGATSAGPGSAVNPTDPVAPGGGAVPGTPTVPVTPVGPVPEPASWAMMILGFFAMGTVLRRRVVSSVRGDRLRT